MQSNAAAAELALEYGASAVTDVTGFGLLGHLLETRTGTPLPNLVRRTLLRPLGVEGDAFFPLPRRKTLLERTAATERGNRIEQEMMQLVKAEAREEFGVDILDFGIKQLVLPEDVTKSVFDAMKKREENKAKKAALSIHGRLPVVYAPEGLWPAALRFKTQLNENSKTPAKAEAVPELCHNEVVGFEGSRELLSKMCIVLLRDPDEEDVVRERMEAVKEEAEGRVGGLVELWARGSSRMGRMLSAILLGDAVSVYLAVLYGVDPTPVETISRIKRRVARLRVVERVLDELVRRPLS